MDGWIDEDDIWLARVAIIHQLASVSETDARTVFSLRVAAAGDREFFIRKAIGWALREYATHRSGGGAGVRRRHTSR